MKLKSTTTFVLIVLCVFKADSVLAGDDDKAGVKPQEISPDDQTVDIVAAAEALLGTLSDAEKSSALFKVNDEEQRLRWANLPTGIFSRTGLRMGNLKPEQFNAVMFSRH